MSLTMHSC